MRSLCVYENTPLFSEEYPSGKRQSELCHSSKAEELTLFIPGSVSENRPPGVTIRANQFSARTHSANQVLVPTVKTGQNGHQGLISMSQKCLLDKAIKERKLSGSWSWQQAMFVSNTGSVSWTSFLSWVKDKNITAAIAI